MTPQRLSQLKWTKTLLGVFLLFTLIISACGAAATPAYEADMAEAPREAAPEAPSPGGGLADSTQAIQRIVIKNASLRIVVTDPTAAMDAVVALADETGGYVVSARLDQIRLDSGAEVPRASATIRVPAERLDEVLDRIAALSDRDPLYKNIESQDVTSDYVDLQSRLRNLENTEQQLTAIQEKATQTDDVLDVYNRIIAIREQIEVIKGQIQYYEEAAALSAVSVDLVANESIQPLSIAGWQPVGVARDAVQALINTVRSLVSVVIWVVIYLLPVLALLYLIFVLPLSLLWKALRRRRKAAAPPASPLPPSQPSE